jgi:hypothetical protein
MADVKISGLPASTVPLTGTEVLPIVQGTTTKQVSVTNLTAGRTISVASGSATTPSYGIGDTGLGLYSRASVRLSFAIAGADTGVEIGPSTFALSSGSTINWTSGTLPSSGIDLILARDAAGTLAQRDGTNAQTQRLYRSYTNSSNYSRISLGWSSSTAILATEGLGTGTRGNIAFGTAALATTATVGYVMIPSCAGAPTGVPADIPTGQVAMHYDSTNNRIYVYNGAWRMIAVV